MPAAAEEQGWGSERDSLQVFPKVSPPKCPVKEGIIQKNRKTEVHKVSGPPDAQYFCKHERAGD